MAIEKSSLCLGRKLSGVIESDASYLLTFEPFLSQQELRLLPSPYRVVSSRQRVIDLSDAPVCGWPDLAVASPHGQPISMVGIDRHTLRQCAFNGLTSQERKAAELTVPEPEYFQLAHYIRQALGVALPEFSTEEPPTVL